MYEKLTKCQNFTWFCLKNSKVPEFYTIFATKCPNFTRKFPKNIFSRIFAGGMSPHLLRLRGTMGAIVVPKNPKLLPNLFSTQNSVGEITAGLQDSCRGVFRGRRACPFAGEFFFCTNFQCEKYFYAKSWTLLKMYTWNVPLGTPFSDF